MSKYGSTLTTTLSPYSRQFPSYVGLVHRIVAVGFNLEIEGMIHKFKSKLRFKYLALINKAITH